MLVPFRRSLAAEDEGQEDDDDDDRGSSAAIACPGESSAEEDSASNSYLPRSKGYAEAATAELLFLCRMKCIADLKQKIEEGRFMWDEGEKFRTQMHELKQMWNELTFTDVEIASRSNGKHLGRLFEVLTLRVPQVYVDVIVPVDWDYGSDKKVAYKLERRVAQDSLFYTSLEGLRKYFPYLEEAPGGDPCDLEMMWRQHIDESTTASALPSYKHWQNPVDVEVVGVNLRIPHPSQRESVDQHPPDPDLLLMYQLSKASPEEPYETAAHAFVYICWKKQRPFYLITLLCLVASIAALADITYCTKVLECELGRGDEPCCLRPEVRRRWSPIFVFVVGVWLLLTEAIHTFVLIRETKYSFSSLLGSSKTFEILLEATTTVIAGFMAWEGWIFAKQHYIQFFFVVSCRWLHLLYILIPLPMVGKTVLPMYKAVVSYESRAFIIVNLLMLAGAFQAYISLRSDINYRAYPEGLEQPIGDALLQQYRLNFLGDFSIEEIRGENLEINETTRTISTQIGDPEQRRGMAVFMIFVTFLQAVLMLNLYIGILGEAYQRHKDAVQSEFLQFRAHFMLKTLCLVHVIDKHRWLRSLNTSLARFDPFVDADALWVLRRHKKKADDAVPDLLDGEIPQYRCEEGQSPGHMRKLTRSMSLISRGNSVHSFHNDD